MLQHNKYWILQLQRNDCGALEPASACMCLRVLHVLCAHVWNDCLARCAVLVSLACIFIFDLHGVTMRACQ